MRARKTAVKIVQMHLPLREGGNLDHGTGRRNSHRLRIGCRCKNSKITGESEKEGVQEYSQI